MKTEHVDRERVLRGYTQAALAKRARVDPGTLSDLLCGKRRPTLGTVSALCQALGLTLADVIAFESDSRPSAPVAAIAPRARG